MFLNGLRCGALIVLGVAFLVTGCAKAVVTTRHTENKGGHFPTPERIIVQDFAATIHEIPPDDPLRRLIDVPAQPQTEEKIRLTRKLGTEIADQLVERIVKLGLPAEHAHTEIPPRSGDIVIKGAIVSIDEGSRLKRIIIGFGAGAGELKTLVEVKELTSTGARSLLSEEIVARGGKMPGMLFTMGIAVAAGPAGLAIAPAAASGPAGIIGQSAATSGSANVAKELGPESIQAATKKTVKKITEELTEIFKQHGWI